MKKLFTLILLTISYIGFAQSFSADSKSMSVPRYANQTAINTAIPAPAEGMLVFNNALDQFAYYTGTAWTNFPSAGGGGTTYTTHVPINTYANATAINAIASPVAGMLVYNSATNEVWFRGASTWAAMPTATTPWATTNDNITYTGTGKTLAAGATAYAFPTALATFNGIGESNTSPVMLVQSFAGNQNWIRYVGGDRYQEQVITHSSTPANAKIEWFEGTTFPVARLSSFEIKGDGDFTGNKTAFGETSSGAIYNPPIATKTFTGTTSSTVNGVVSFSHGLTAFRILDVKIHVFDGTSVYAPRGFGAFNVYFTDTSISIRVNNSTFTSKNYVAYVTYL
ncbi:MAG: hypothetical protein U5M51_02825 [Emticicia sp.]|nr:hypothetical protein [Emticicia sp.]